MWLSTKNVDRNSESLGLLEDVCWLFLFVTLPFIETKMNYAALFLFVCAILGAEAYVPQSKKASTFDLKRAAAGLFTAATLASNVVTLPASAFDINSGFGTTQVVSEKVVREGLYKDYEVDLVQEVDDARSTFKGAKETKSKKGK